MQRQWIAVVALLVTAGWVMRVQGEDQKPVQTERLSETATSSADKAGGAVHRVSEINGMKVRNTANKELGSIKDIVIELQPGEVRYAALSYGGFLGLGDKLFAVPWDAFEHRRDVSNGDSYLVLDIDEATLKRAEGFDDSNWPNFGELQFTGKIDTFYEKFRKRERGDATAERQAQGGRTTDANPAAQVAGKKGRMILRASAIMDMKVRNEAQKELGEVDDLVIDMKAGKIRYAALSYGGFLGLGDKLFAVPWKAFDFRHDISEKEAALVLNLDEARLRKATGFDKDHWPNFADPSITRELDTYYNVSGDRAATEATEGAIVRDRKKQ